MDSIIEYPIIIPSGATFVLPISYLDEDGVIVDLAGYTAKMQIRKSHEDSVVVLELSTDNGRILIDVEAGTITLTISAVDTAALPSEFSGVYDLQLIAGAVVDRLLQGPVKVSPEVTR